MLSNKPTEIATIIFFRHKGVKRRHETVTALYIDGELFEYNENSEEMEQYIDGFSEGVAFKKPDGSVQFVRGTAQLLDNQEPPMHLNAVVTRGVEWQRESANKPEVFNGRFTKASA
jgi:hypothetical protein